jgi:DNA-binding NtrC family response regulator
MPSLRDLRADGGLLDYVAAFVADRIADPEQCCVLTMRVMRSIQDTLPDHGWPRNLRELKNYTERFLLDGGAQDPSSWHDAGVPSEQAPAPAEPPPSLCVPSSEILGRRAKAGEVSVEDLLKAYVTRIYFLTGQNKSETARLCGFDRRTVSRYIDPERLARLIEASKASK